MIINPSLDIDMVRSVGHHVMHEFMGASQPFVTGDRQTYILEHNQNSMFQVGFIEIASRRRSYGTTVAQWSAATAIERPRNRLQSAATHSLLARMDM